MTEPFTFRPAGDALLDESDLPAAWWGDGSGVLGACGESVILAGAAGVGKSTLAQQLALGRAGFPEYRELLGHPIAPGAGRVLYLAMDRPRQILRSMRRLVGSSWRDELNDRVAFWMGPPPYDLARAPSVLAEMCHDARADTVVVDSLKDAAVGLTDDEVGAGYNRARQVALRQGVEVIELHHIRKAPNGQKRGTPSLDDLYGSTWLTAGAGSVLFVGGEPGDPVVTVHHLKQPADEVGPLRLQHDRQSGRTRVVSPTDLCSLLSAKPISAREAAVLMVDTPDPSAAQIERVRRQLRHLVEQGRAVEEREGTSQTAATLWRAA